MAVRSPSTDKLSEALRLLDEAAMEKKDEIQSLINEKYQNLKATVLGIEPIAKRTWNELSHSAREVSKMAQERSKEVARQIDHSVHLHPWSYIGGAAFGGLLLGFILGKRD